MRAPMKKKKQVAMGWGTPQSHRFAWQLIADLSRLDECEQVGALRKAPRCIREFLYFALSPRIEHDLSKMPMDYDVIPTGAFTETPELGDEDLFSRECMNLTRFFAKGVHATLTSARRLALWRQIQERVTREERELLDAARMRREVPGISRAAVERAFPGMLAEPPERHASTQPVPEISYSSCSVGDADAPRVFEPATTQEPSRAPTENELRYAELMARMGW